MVRFLRKTKEQYVMTEGYGKATGWRVTYHDGKWVEELPPVKVARKKVTKKKVAKKIGKRKTAKKKVTKEGINQKFWARKLAQSGQLKDPTKSEALVKAIYKNRESTEDYALVRE